MPRLSKTEDEARELFVITLFKENENLTIDEAHVLIKNTFGKAMRTEKICKLKNMVIAYKLQQKGLMK